MHTRETYYTSMEMYANKCTESKSAIIAPTGRTAVSQVLLEDIRLSIYVLRSWIDCRIIWAEHSELCCFLCISTQGNLLNILDCMFCHVTYTFQSEFTLYRCLNVKKLLARSRHKIWSLSECNWTWTQNHLVHKWTLNHLAKLVEYSFLN